MVIKFTALYCEAQIFIEHYHLKKVLDNDSTHFQQFTSESAQILLTITGTGEIAAACAVSTVCTKRPPARQDFLLNIGICACPIQQNGIFFIHKLIEQASGKTYYPDILYRHEFQEAELITGMVPWKNSGKKSAMQLHDMEAAALYQAGAYYFEPHQMIFIKAVSDTGRQDNRLSNGYVKQIIENYNHKIYSFIQQLLQIQQAAQNVPDRLTADVQSPDSLEQWFCRLCADLHCSKSMSDLLRKYIHYAALAEIDYQAATQKMYQEQKLPCKDKREGKQRFEELKQQLF